MNVKWKRAVLTCNLTLNFSETTKLSANICNCFLQWKSAFVGRTFLLAREDMLVTTYKKLLRLATFQDCRSVPSLLKPFALCRFL